MTEQSDISRELTKKIRKINSLRQDAAVNGFATRVLGCLGCFAVIVFLFTGLSFLSSAGVFVFGGFIVHRFHERVKETHQEIQEAIRELATMEDVRAISPLLTLIDGYGLVYVASADIVPGLCRLLPGLRFSDLDWLSEADLSKMRSLLFNSTRPDLLIALLRSFAQIGDNQVLDDVRKIASGTFRNMRDRHVREAAQECLPYLEQAVQRTKERQMLLRAAETPGGADTLLRPAKGNAGVDPGTLLRPIRDEEVGSE